LLLSFTDGVLVDWDECAGRIESATGMSLSVSREWIADEDVPTESEFESDVRYLFVELGSVPEALGLTGPRDRRPFVWQCVLDDSAISDARRVHGIDEGGEVLFVHNIVTHELVHGAGRRGHASVDPHVADSLMYWDIRDTEDPERPFRQILQQRALHLDQRSIEIVRDHILR